MLSLSNEVLIYIEHNGSTRVNELIFWPKNNLRGALGKLEALRFIERTKEDSIKITDSGIEFVDLRLDKLHINFDKWLGQWQCVLFGISEKKRPMRDKLRRFLKSEGFKNIFKTIWIKPLHEPNDNVEKYISKLNITENAIVIDFTADGMLTSKLLAHWPMQTIKRQYDIFIKNAQQILRSFKKDNQKSAFLIKKTIFELADILDQEPNLPAKSMPTDWPRKKALDLYKQLKSKLG